MTVNDFKLFLPIASFREVDQREVLRQCAAFHPVETISGLSLRGCPVNLNDYD